MRRMILLLVVLAGLAAPGGASAATGWDWPVQPHRVVAGFDPPPAAEPWLPGHRGVDLLGHVGMAVHAAGAGVVAFAGRVGGLPVVTVDHPDGLSTTYEPVRATVRAGDRVEAGDVLGRLVRRGSHCAPQACLHWGLRRGSVYLDPLALVGDAEVRLLPVPPVLLRPMPPRNIAGAGSISLGALFVLWRFSRAGRRACRAAAGPPSCASGRSGSP